MGRIGCQLGLELSYNANQATLIQHGNPDIPCLEDAKQQWTTSGLSYKHIKIVNDDRCKWGIYYKHHEWVQMMPLGS